MKIPDTYDELRAIPNEQIPILWMQVTHNPTTLSPKNLIRPLWYRIQCMRRKHHLDQKYITRLNKYARAPEEYLKSARKIKYELKPGTLIRKTYKGQLFTLRVITDNRFEYNGKTYASLSAAAYGWRYKYMFERDKTIEQIAKTEHKAERTIYKYLALAYLSPKIVSDIMDGTTPAIDLQTLFVIAAKHIDFKAQEKMFYN